MQKQDWNDYLYFLYVARLGSLKAAANSLKVNQSTVFRRINALEDKLNVKLFSRHSQGYTLTEVGENIFPEVEKMEGTFHSIVRQLSGQDVRLSGKIKISTTASIAYAWLPHYVKGFQQKFPEIQLDVDITQKHANLSRREADVVISAGNSRSDVMVGRPLASIHFGLFAHKDYLKGKQPWRKGEYTNYDFLMPNEFFTGLKAKEMIMKKLSPSQVVLSCDKFSGLHQFCKEAMGVALLPVYMSKQTDSLVELERLDESASSQIWIMTHPDLKHTARIKAFMGYMRKATKG